METVEYVVAEQLSPLGELAPRKEESVEHIRALAEALEQGAELPPLLVDRRTLRVVGGWHRRQAHVRVFGEDAKVPCVLRAFASEQEIFEAAVKDNAAHGLRFSREDYAQCARVAERLKIKPADLAPMLQVSASTLNWSRVSNLRPAPRVEPPGGDGMTRKPQANRPTGRQREWSGRGLRGNPAPPPKEVAEKLEREKEEVRQATPIPEPRDKVARFQHFCQNLTLMLDNRLVDANYVALVGDVARLKLAVNDFLARGQKKED